MTYAKTNSPTGGFLAPKDYIGFLTLVNPGDEDKYSCRVVGAVVLCSLRIPLLTVGRSKADSSHSPLRSQEVSKTSIMDYSKEGLFNADQERF